ncbi:MAG TPA: hypothetical protein VNZ85_13600 [Caulobacter sp.]|nr:hypothetical protein [Caulobacter sp.]
MRFLKREDRVLCDSQDFVRDLPPLEDARQGQGSSHQAQGLQGVGARGGGLSILDLRASGAFTDEQLAAIRAAITTKAPVS